MAVNLDRIGEWPHTFEVWQAASGDGQFTLLASLEHKAQACSAIRPTGNG